MKIVVPFAAGGTTDVVARQLAQKLSEAWGQSVVVENKPGAGGNIGADMVAKSPDDGYTLLMTSGSIVAANPHMYKNMGFDPAKDLAPITNVASGPQVIVVGAAQSAKDLREFIAYAKATVPLVRSGIFAGAALVFLYAMKELPATLLLRPIGFETLATEIWKLTSVGAYSRAALPALLLIAVSAPFVYLLSSRPSATQQSSQRVESTHGRPLRRRVPGDDLLPRLSDRRVPARPGLVGRDRRLASPTCSASPAPRPARC